MEQNRAPKIKPQMCGQIMFNKVPNKHKWYWESQVATD